MAKAEKSPLSKDGKRVGLRDLAEYLDLSPATISIVLNQSPVAASIPLVTRQRVLAAAKKFDYRPNLLARSLRLKRTHTVGIIAPEHSEGYFTSLMCAIETRLLQAGYLYFTVSHLGKADLLDEYANLLMNRNVDGLLLINTLLKQELPIPTVAVSSHSPFRSVTNLVLDHEAAAAMTLRHLQELGHKRIAFMKGQRNALDAEPRWQALIQCARALGIAVDPQLSMLLEHNSWSPDLGYPIVLDLLKTRPDCTAIVCFNDQAAIGAVRALADCDLRCPVDISIIGFDDISSAGFCIPRLTTIRQPLQQMGEIAAQTLIEQIESPGKPGNRLLKFTPELVVRESTGVAAGAHAGTRRAAVKSSARLKRVS